MSVISKILCLCLILFGFNGSANEASHSGSLRVGLKHSPPFTFKSETGEWQGLSIDLWERAAQKLGVKYEYVEATLPDLLTKLRAKELDLVIGSLTVTADREETMDFTHSFYESGLGILSNHADRSLFSAIVDGVFSFEFLRAVLVLLTILLIAGAALWFAERKRNPEQFGGPASKGIGNGLWWSAVTMTTVGYGDRSPITLAGRLIAIVWMFASIMMISSLTAMIAATLTVRNLQPGIQSFDDLSGRKVGTIAASSSDDYLKQAGIKDIIYFDDMNAALTALDNKAIEAVVYDAPILNYYLQNSPKKNRLSLVQDKGPSQQYAFALQAESALREILNRILLSQLASEKWKETMELYLPSPK